MLALLLLPFTLVIPLMAPTLNYAGCQRSSIASWGAISSTITSTSFRSARTVNGLMAASFPRHLRHLLQSQKLNGVNCCNRHNTVSLMQTTWTLCLATVLLLAVFATPSSLSAKQHSTTGRLVLRISCWVVSLTPFGNFGPQQVHWLGAFIVTVTLNSLVTRSAIISLTTVPKLLLLLLSASWQMD